MNAHCKKQKQNTKKLAMWTLAWVISLALVSFSTLLPWHSDTYVIMATLANLAIGFGMVWANRTYLKDLDELQKKIQLDAMAATLGIAVVVGLSYSLLEVNKIIGFHAEISHIVFLIGITYSIGIAVGVKRYQ